MKQINKKNNQSQSALCGTSTEIPAPIKVNYFQPEPRKTLFWLQQFKQWGESGVVIDVEHLLPSNISIDYIAEYIADPKGTIAKEILRTEEVHELQKPQRIILFNFLKKLASFDSSNEQITSEFKNYIAKTIFGFSPNQATAEKLITFIDSGNEDIAIDIEAFSQIKAFVEGLNSPLLYETQQNSVWQTTSLVKFMSSQMTVGSKRDCYQFLNDYPLPLCENKLNISPFKPEVLSKYTKNEYCPSIVISSPLLLLSEGKRRINLKLLYESCAGTDTFDFEFNISTAKGWQKIEPVKPETGLEVETESIKVNDGNKSAKLPFKQLNFVFELDFDFPSVEPIEDPDQYQLFAIEQACLLVTSNQSTVNNIEIRNIELTVDVEGLQPSAVCNQDTIISPEGSLELFGTEAPIEALFSFCHPELAVKPLDSMNIKLNWLGKPECLTEHYQAYPRLESDFTVDVITVQRHKRLNETNKEKLFVDKLEFPQLSPSLLGYGNWEEDEPDPLEQELYFQLQLNGEDFGQSEYPLLMTNYAIEKAAYVQNVNDLLPQINETIRELKSNQDYIDEKGDVLKNLEDTLAEFITTRESTPFINIIERLCEFLKSCLKNIYNKLTMLCELLTALMNAPLEVNMPYNPQVNAIEIQYTTKRNINYNNENSSATELTVYKTTPAGYSIFQGGNIDLDFDEQHGCLYFAFNPLTPNTEARLYFHGIPGDSDLPQISIVWQYITADGWENLTKNIINDGTYELTQSGLLKWKVPKDMVLDNTMMPLNFNWLRVVICNQQQVLPEDFWRTFMTIQDVKPNGFYISRQLNDLIEPDNIRNTITNNIINNVTNLTDETELKFDDYDSELIDFYQIEEGKAAEQDEAFWTRVFSYVRYKGRAVTVQDYEDLILEEFNNVAQVKCIPREAGSRKVKGVIVEKNYSSQQPYLLKPKVARQLLKEIKTHLPKQATSFMLPDQMIEFEAINPIYRDIGFRMVVNFSCGIEDESGRQRLLEDIRRFVNPWVYEKNSPMKFGCWFDYGSFVSYLQSRSYINAILNLKLNIADGENLCPPEQFAFQPEEVAIAVDSFTTIEVIENLNDYNPLNYRGIGYMEVGVDFYIK